MKATMMSGGSNEWRTPNEILDLVRAIAPIAYDPATTDENPTSAARFDTARTDGLSQDWRERSGGGLVFVNPPYGRALSNWARKIASYEDVETCVLVPARTSPRWFRELHDWCDWRADLHGRLRFVRPDGAPSVSAPFPSTMFYRGPRARAFLAAFRERATIIPGDRTLAELVRNAPMDPTHAD